MKGKDTDGGRYALRRESKLHPEAASEFHSEMSSRLQRGISSGLIP